MKRNFNLNILFLIFFLQGCAIFENVKTSFKPLKSYWTLKTYSRSFKQIVNEHEISLIENREYDVILELKKLNRTVKTDIPNVRYNIHACSIPAKGCYENIHFLRGHLEALLDLEQDLSNLIRKLKAINRIVKKESLKKKKEKKILKVFKPNLL